jgi:DNA helicase-2/ATP-dependent DNA helicase PcrA
MDYANNHEISLYETIQLMRKGEIPTSDLKITSAALEGVKRFILLTEELKKELEQAEIATFIETLIKKLHYKEHLIDEEKGNEEEAMERYENVGQLINMAKNTLDKGKEGLEQFMNEIALMSDDAGNDEKIEKVQLMTIHKSKGLEFPIVFLVGLEDGVFPGNQASCDPEELAEERRLMYVAVTRAQDVLFFSRAESRMEF